MQNIEFTHASGRDVGSELARLRQNSGLKQAEIAKSLGVDTSRVSRIETGEIIADHEELRLFVKAIGTKEAEEYAQYCSAAWKNVEKPSYWHPNLQDLSRAEECLTKIESFIHAPEISAVTKAQALLHKESLQRAAAFLLDLEHSVSFIGDIGVGKSTAICAMTGLLLEGEDVERKSLRDRVVLETGAGGTTICEVHIRSDSDTTFGLVVLPHSDEEVYQSVSDFCAALVDNSDNGEGKVRGVSQEINRAIRNMSGLGRIQTRGQDGKVIRSDPAADLAKSCGGSLPELTAEVLRRIKLEQRRQCEFRFEEGELQAGLRKLRQIFADVNNGRRADVSLPRRIDLIAPLARMGTHRLTIRIIDTKGVDGTAIRPDVRAHLDDPRTVTVLCSRYNSAPDPTMQGLIENLASTGADSVLGERVALLILSRTDEALEMKDDSGLPSESVEVGYHLQRDQVRAKLSNQKNGESVPILFLDVLSDDPRKIMESLIERFENLRLLQGRRIGEIDRAVRELVKRHDEVQTKASQDEVRRRLRIFLRDHRELPVRSQRIHEQLIRQIGATNARTVWASARRNGSWFNLDVYHFLGVGSAIDAQVRSQPVFSGLDEIIKNMLGDDKLMPAHDYLHELRRNIPVWRESFLAEATSAGREIFRSVLREDDELWDDCANRWGAGSGYRDYVASSVRNWCQDAAREELHSNIERSIQNSWDACFLRPLAALCDASVPSSHESETTERPE